ncbi:MAG: lipoate-protein ligase B [Robiginitomaculum sp.]|nr:MAG: lipoate-protein ligase B [Robiginitomaculum sp.]
MNASNPVQKIDWLVSKHPISYPIAVKMMEQRVQAIRDGIQREQLWLLEHPPLITAGTSAKREDLIDPNRFDVFQTGRGGQFTYHGPGQRVVYVMLDLSRRGRDIRGFVRDLEQWLIGSLAQMSLSARRYDDRVGVWVDRPAPDGTISEAKIAAIGIRVRSWVSYHGISLNVCPDLSHFEAIVPCGITEFGVTSLVDLGRPTSMDQADQILKTEFAKTFGPVELIDTNELKLLEQ